MTITVYSKPGCPQCDATYRALLTFGVSFEIINLTGNQDALDYVVKLGHLQAPVVVAGDRHWSGYRPDQIKELVRLLTEQGVKLTPRDPKKDKSLIDAMIKDIKAGLSSTAKTQTLEPAMATA